MRAYSKIKFMNYEHSRRIIPAKGIHNMFNGTIAHSSPNLEKELADQIQDVFTAANEQDQKVTSPYHIAVKTLNIERKIKIMKAVRENHEVTNKAHLNMILCIRTEDPTRKVMCLKNTFNK